MQYLVAMKACAWMTGYLTLSIREGLPTIRPERAEVGESQGGTDYVRRSAGGDAVRLVSISSEHRSAASFTRKPIFG